MYFWSISGSPAREMVNRIMPYLRRRQHVAEAWLQSYPTVAPRGARPWRDHHLHPGTWSMKTMTKLAFDYDTPENNAAVKKTKADLPPDIGNHLKDKRARTMFREGYAVAKAFNIEATLKNVEGRQMVSFRSDKSLPSGIDFVRQGPPQLNAPNAPFFDGMTVGALPEQLITKLSALRTNIKTEYEAPMTFEEAVKALDETSEANFHDFDADVLADFDDMQSYEDGVLAVLNDRFGSTTADPEHIQERMGRAHLVTGMWEDVIEDGRRFTRQHLYEQVLTDPAVQQANAEVRPAVAQLRAAHHALNKLWARKLMAEHKAAWEKGVKDADRYAELLKDLFEKSDAEAAE